MDPQKDYRDFEHAQQVQEYRAIQDLALGSCDLDPSSSILRIEKTLFLHTGTFVPPKSPRRRPGRQRGRNDWAAGRSRRSRLLLAVASSRMLRRAAKGAKASHDHRTIMIRSMIFKLLSPNLTLKCPANHSVQFGLV